MCTHVCARTAAAADDRVSRASHVGEHVRAETERARDHSVCVQAKYG